MGQNLSLFFLPQDVFGYSPALYFQSQYHPDSWHYQFCHEKFNESIALVGINSNDSTEYPDDSFENMKKIANEKGIKFDYLVDEKQDVAKKYGAICTPDPFLFDQNRRLIFHGRIDNAMNPDDTATENTMQKNIEKYLAGEKIEKDFDPSIGCSINWKLQQT